MKPPADLDRLAEDWITLWQSELAAMAADPELAEAWAAAVALGAAWWRAQAAGLGRMPPWPPGGAMPGFPFGGPADANPWAHDAPGPSPAGDAYAGQQPARHGCNDATALLQRLAELEQRLAEVEHSPGPGKPDRPRTRRPKSKP